MMSPEHRQAMDLAFEAGRLRSAGRACEAAPLYLQAAELEKQALDNVPREKQKTRGVLAVSWAAMLYKARAFRQAEAGILDLMREPETLEGTRWELRDILQAVWEEESQVHSDSVAARESQYGTNGSDETVEGVLRGLQLDDRWVEIDLQVGKSRRCYFHHAPLDDVIGPLLNRPVVARGSWDVVNGHKRFELKEISLRA